MTGWKTLKVVAPAFTQRFSELFQQPVETPVFVSPYVEMERECFRCNVKYRPLIYRHGEVKAHHFHNDKPFGGIYHIHDEFKDAAGAIAVLECSGCIKHDLYDNVYIAPSVLVKGIVIVCVNCYIPTDYALFTESDSGLMVPYCELCFKQLCFDNVLRPSRYVAKTLRGYIHFKEEGNARMENAPNRNSWLC